MTKPRYPENHPQTIYPQHDCITETGTIETTTLSSNCDDCLLWYDMPILFVGNWNGARRMFQVIDEGQPGQLYEEATMRMSVSTPTQAQIDAVINNTLPLRDAILSGELFMLETAFSDYNVLRAWKMTTFDECDLPKQGIYLAPT